MTSTAEKCSDFAEAFIKKATLPDGGVFIPRTSQYADIDDIDFTKDYVRKWLSRLAPSKAAGPNAVSPRVYQLLAAVLASPIIPMHSIYSRMLKLVMEHRKQSKFTQP